ncbi:superinfection immunity protein [Salmonella enterica]|nr:superinfection immunity protein [Salmonella enterica]
MSGGVILFLILLVVYFIPAIIASNRKHSNSGAIACLNIFLGWTFIGWVVALVWAFTDNVRKGE